MTWVENIHKWRALPEERKLELRWAAIPLDVFQSMAFENEPVDIEMLRAIHAQAELPAMLKRRSASSATPK